MGTDRTRVLVVDDSPAALLLLVNVLQSDPAFEVVGPAHDGAEAMALVARHHPDVVLMDVHMPTMDGWEATRQIMETHPVPIVMASAGGAADEVSLTFRALEAGAVAFVDKTLRVGAADFDVVAGRIKQTLKLMAEVRVVRRWKRSPRSGRRAPLAPAPVAAAVGARLVAIGASTGGPPVLEAILAGLPREFPAPLAIVQHIAPGFVQGLADWLTQTTRVPCHVATHETPPVPGHAYLAPDDVHLGFDLTGRMILSKAPAENGLRPAVGFLFRSVAEVLGRQAVGVLLTGMGRDGAAELNLLRQAGAVTIAQDKDSSIVHGMPGAAVALGAATYVLPPEQIAVALGRLTQRGA